MTQPHDPIHRIDLAHVLEHSASLWQAQRGCHLLISGGTGFFGRWLLESFAFCNDALDLGMRATVLSRDPAAFARKAPALASRSDLHWLAGDVRNCPELKGSVDLILHAAATSSRPVEDQEMFETIVQGTRGMLKLAANTGARRLLMISSGAVYGRVDAEQGPICEDHPAASNLELEDGAYAQGKRRAEQLVLQAATSGSLQVSIARCFAFVGPHLPMDGHFAVGNFIAQALRGEDLVLNGDGSAMRSYLYAADLALWLWTLLFHGSNGRAYNVGDTQSIRIADLAALTLEIAGVSERRVHLNPAPALKEARPFYVPSTHRAASELGLCSRIPLREGIARSLQWLRQSRRCGNP